MADKITPEQRSKNMRAIKSKDMKPEMIVRKLVHGMGYRYRLHRHDLPGRPDLVFPSRRKIIFVHGCFWHQHRDPNCKIAHIPKSREDYWRPKLERTAARDREHLQALQEDGWSALVIWECEIKALNEIDLKERLRCFLD